MSYHKFPNLREKFQGDLSSKLIENIGLLDFDTLSCNCNIRSKVEGKSPYSSNFRLSIVVYKNTCKLSRKTYIGNTKQKLKARLMQNYNEIKDLVKKGLMSDSFAKNVAFHFNTNEKMKK